MTNDATPEELEAMSAALRAWTREQWIIFCGGRAGLLPLAEWTGLLQEVGWKPSETAERAAHLLYGDQAAQQKSRVQEIDQ